MHTTPIKILVDNSALGVGVVPLGVVMLGVVKVGMVGVSVGGGSVHFQILQYPHPVSTLVTQSVLHGQVPFLHSK